MVPAPETIQRCGPSSDRRQDQSIPSLRDRRAPRANAAEWPPHVAHVARAKIDRERNDIKAYLAEDANGARHVVGRGNEEPPVAGFRPEKVAGKDGIFVDIYRGVLNDDAVGRDPDIDQILAH